MTYADLIKEKIMSKVNISINGANGRMGIAIKSIIEQNSSKYNLVSSLTRDSSDEERLDACNKSDILLDFSSPNALPNLLQIAKKTKIAVLVGTTGLTDEHYELIREFSKTNAVMAEANTSIVATLVAHFAAKAAYILSDYDAEIIEAHHRDKKDAPSGTALAIGRIVSAAKGLDFENSAVFSRAPDASRGKAEIGYSSIRGGKIAGEHEVILAGDDDLFTVGCRAFSRDSFASGALKLALWLHGKKPRIYSVKEYIDLV